MPGESTRPVDLLLAVSRDAPRTLGAQIEDALRGGVRDGSLHAGAQLPSTRDLARQLGISRRIVVDAYAQLASEGYLELRQGARPRVARTAAPIDAAPSAAAAPDRVARFDFRPSVPDVSTFPRAAWLRSVRHALADIVDADLGYGDAAGLPALRGVLAGYLGRVRGVVAAPERVVVTSGYTQGLGIVCAALAELGATRVAIEDPGDPEAWAIVARAGLQPVPVPVDGEGIVVAELARAAVDAVVLTPAHQHPTGVVLSGERRTELLAWLRAGGAIAIEDDYDAEYRYDRAAVGALQGLEPERVVYAGSASKTLAPALRLGWLVVPAALAGAVARGKLLADRGTARIDQLAFAHFLERGELDRHLRRMRTRYRARRDALVAAIAEAVPEARARGIAAGLHATIELPPGDDEQAILAEGERRGLRFETLGAYRFATAPGPPTLLLGYARVPEAGIGAGVRELAAAILAARGQ